MTSSLLESAKLANEAFITDKYVVSASRAHGAVELLDSMVEDHGCLGCHSQAAHLPLCLDLLYQAPKLSVPAEQHALSPGTSIAQPGQHRIRVQAQRCHCREKEPAWPKRLYCRRTENLAILKRQPLSPYVIQHFYNTEDAIFLEFMSGGNLGIILNDEQVKDESTQRVIRVEKLPATRDVLQWVRQLAAAAAWLEQLGLAHCDIRPANILLSDAGDIKLADFDHTCRIGETLPCLTEPFARLLGHEGGSDRGTYGTAGSRTEQFAIGSVVYALTRGHDPYEDHWWGPDHGPICQDKLQNMEFPDLGGESYDDLIDTCWHGRYESIAQLSEDIVNLDGYSWEVIKQKLSVSEITSMKHECQMLVQNGVLGQLLTC